MSRFLGDLSGAFADLGTFLPLIVGMFAVAQLDPVGVMSGFGLFALAVAVVYRRPVPVQPMKAVAALVIAGGLGAADVAASGILLAVVLLLIMVSGLIGRLARLVPETVMFGIQLGVGLHLALAGSRLVVDDPGPGVVALAFLLTLQLTRWRLLGVPLVPSDLEVIDPQYYQSLRWLLENVKGSPTILEAYNFNGGYRWGSRYSIYTGLPTVIGWDWHQKQQRNAVGGWVVDERTRDVGEIYNTIGEDTARALLDKYAVEYLIVGELERALYKPEGLAKFERWAAAGSIEPVFVSEDREPDGRPAVTIYRLDRDGQEVEAP